MELTLLGTGGGPRPSPHRAPTAQSVRVGGRTIVVDAGNGVAQQMARAGLNPADLSDLLITHLHVDHAADLGMLPMAAWITGRTESMRVWGPPPTASSFWSLIDGYADDLVHRTASTGRPDFRSLVTAQDVATAGTVFEDADVRVSAALVNHPPFEVALAYRVDSADGSIAISGDTTPCDAMVDLARDVDGLVHEVVHPTALTQLAQGTNASTIKQHMVDSHTMLDHVGQVAQRAGARLLVLSHLIPHTGVSDEEWTAPVREHFDGDVLVGHDLDVVTLTGGTIDIQRAIRGNEVLS